MQILATRGTCRVSGGYEAKEYDARLDGRVVRVREIRNKEVSANVSVKTRTTLPDLT